MQTYHYSQLIAAFAALASTAAFAGANAAPASGTYTVYSYGVKKGTSGWAEEAGKITIAGDAGLGSSWSGTINFTGDTLKSAAFEVKGASAAKVSYSVKDGSVTHTAPAGSETSKLQSGAGLYYPLAPVLLQRILNRYPAHGHGVQEVPGIDMLTGKPRPVTAVMDGVETRTVAGKPCRIRIWRITSAPSPEAVVYTDETNLPLYWWAPAVQFELVLAGYEELRPGAKYAASLSQPVFKVAIDRDVAMPMTDGAILRADIYRPDAPGKFPVLLQRTCYDRSEFGTADGEYYAQRGYVYVTQHVRGRGDSDGDFTPCLTEAADGADSVGWCARQPWSNGKVGMLGASYNGFCCWMAAKMRPPALKTMIPTVAMPGPPDGAPWGGGSVFVSGMLSWYGLLRDKTKTQPFTQDMTDALNTLPLAEADSRLFGKHIPSYQYWIDRDKYDDMVKQGGYREGIESIDIPVLHVSGWLDTVGIGTRLNYTQMVANGRKNQKLIWGPWSHFTNRESIVGEWDFGPEAYIDIKTTYLRWFDRWLKDIHNGIDTEPPVSTYLLNEHRWEASSGWPADNMTAQRWYLHPSQQRGKTGLLSQQRPVEADKPERYLYDPAMYSYSNNNNRYSFFFGWLSGVDLSSLLTTSKRDRLLYESDILSKPLRLCGPVTARLTAATSAVDTDWAVALVDVTPGGKALAIACGMVRGRFHKSLEAPEELTPDEPVTYNVDMWQTGVKVPAGHRLAVVVLSTLFPDTDRNLNSGGSIAHGTGIIAADQTVYHEPGKESYVVLPVIPDSPLPHR